MSLDLTFKVTDAHAALKQEEPKDYQMIFLKDLDASLTALDLKHELKDKTDMNPNMCRLIYKGKILKDNETLQASKLESGTTVHIVKSAAKHADGEQIPLGKGYNTLTKAGIEEKLKDPVVMEDMMKQFDKMMRSNHARKNPVGAIAKECEESVAIPDAADAAEMLENPKIQEMMQKMMGNADLMEQMFSADGSGNKSIANMMAKESFGTLQEAVEAKVDSMPGGMEALLNAPNIKTAVKEIKKGSLDSAKA